MSLLLLFNADAATTELPLFVGEDQVDALFVGDDEVDAIYIGSTQIYP